MWRVDLAAGHALEEWWSEPHTSDRFERLAACSTPSYDEAHAQEAGSGTRPRSEDPAMSDLQDAVPECMGW